MTSTINVIEEYDKILEYIMDKSETMTSYIKEHPKCEYKLLLKIITHSDLTSSGKRTHVIEPFSKNYLYYLTAEEMEEIDKINPRPFATAHQSNIHLPKKIIFDFLEVDHLENSKEQFKINDYANVYLVNDTLKYFNISYTMKVLKKLNKIPNWREEDFQIVLHNDMTPIELSIAAHGIGIKKNVVFHKLRRSIFKSDMIIILLSKDIETNEKNMFIMLEKNPKFFTVIGEGNESWEKYLLLHDKQAMFDLLKKENLSAGENEKTRKNQAKWRNMLASEMMSYTTSDDEVFCPLTYITANYLSVGTLFRASHIKAFSECSIDEAFDINNGILMVANADSLFDKHLITIDDDGTIIYSYLIENEGPKFKHELKLGDKVFTAILNDKRKEYLKRHREIFREKEVQRKLLSNLADDSSDEEKL